MFGEQPLSQNQLMALPQQSGSSSASLGASASSAAVGVIAQSLSQGAALPGMEMESTFQQQNSALASDPLARHLDGEFSGGAMEKETDLVAKSLREAEEPDVKTPRIPATKKTTTTTPSGLVGKLRSNLGALAPPFARAGLPSGRSTPGVHHDMMAAAASADTDDAQCSAFESPDAEVDAANSPSPGSKPVPRNEFNDSINALEARMKKLREDWEIEKKSNKDHLDAAFKKHVEATDTFVNGLLDDIIKKKKSARQDAESEATDSGAASYQAAQIKLNEAMRELHTHKEAVNADNEKIAQGYEKLNRKMKDLEEENRRLWEQFANPPNQGKEPVASSESECCPGVRSCAKSFDELREAENYTRSLAKKAEDFLLKEVNPALAMINSLQSTVTRLGSRLTAVERDGAAGSPPSNRKERELHPGSKPETGGAWDKSPDPAQENFLNLAKSLLKRENEGYRESESKKGEEALIYKNNFSFVKADGSKKSNYECSKALEILFMQLGMYATENQLTLDRVWYLADRIIMNSIYKYPPTDHDFPSTVVEVIRELRLTRLASLQRRVARVVRTNNSRLTTTDVARKNAMWGQVTVEVRAIAVNILLCDVYRACFAANTIGLAPGGGKVKLHFKVTKREDLNTESVDLDIRRWKRNTKTEIYRAFSPAEKEAVMKKAHESIIAYACLNNNLTHPFADLMVPLAENSVERVERAADAYLVNVEDTGSDTHRGIQLENFPKTKVGEFWTQHPGTDFGRRLANKYPNEFKEWKAGKKKPQEGNGGATSSGNGGNGGGGNGGKGGGGSSSGGNEKKSEEPKGKFKTCQQWRNMGSCDYGTRCFNKTDHTDATAGIQNRVRQVYESYPANARPDWTALTRCLIEGGDPKSLKVAKSPQ